MHMNDHNPARAVAGADFFDIRANYKFFKERETLNYMAPSVSLFNFYWAVEGLNKEAWFIGLKCLLFKYYITLIIISQSKLCFFIT